MADSKLAASFPIRLWTVEEYHAIAETGIFTPNEKVELVAGQIINKVSPQRTTHATAITLTRLLLEELLGDEVLVRTQLPIALHEYSEPEPDLAVVMPDVMRYVEHHPTPAEIYLIIEIADTSLKLDRTLKAKDYAKSGIADYWILNLNQRQLHVFREPNQTDYDSETIFDERAAIATLQFPKLAIQVGQLLPPLR